MEKELQTNSFSRKKTNIYSIINYCNLVETNDLVNKEKLIFWQFFGKKMTTGYWLEIENQLIILKEETNMLIILQKHTSIDLRVVK